MESWDVVIIGSGPAALRAAIASSDAGTKPIVIDGGSVGSGTGAAPVPEPTLPLSITIGFVPASEDAMAARSAAGPLPMITTSHDSMFSRTLREDSFSRR